MPEKWTDLRIIQPTPVPLGLRRQEHDRDFSATVFQNVAEGVHRASPGVAAQYISSFAFERIV
jgi:hypothetical protein